MPRRSTNAVSEVQTRIRRVVARGAAPAICLAPFLLLAGCCSNCTELSQVGAVSYTGPALGSEPGARVAERSSGSRRPAGAGEPAPPQAARAAEGTEPVATGFYVDGKGHFLTVWKPIRACRKLAILDSYEFRAAKLVEANPLSGMALLRVATPNDRHPVFRTAAIIGVEQVSMFAYPIVDGLFTPIDVTETTARAAVGPGGGRGVIELGSTLGGHSAGGPILDRRGDVVGVAVGELNAAWPSGRAYGIGNAALLRFLSAAGVSVLTQGSVPVGDRPGDPNGTPDAGDYTAPVLCSR